MNRLLAVVCLSVLVSSATGWAHTIADLFAREPGNVFPLLTVTNRLDLIDYYNSGQTVAVTNNLVGETTLVEMDSVYLKVQTSAAQVVEMRMVTTGKSDTAIIVIQTVMTPIPDSRLTVWNQYWTQKDTDRYFKMPGIDDFIMKKMPADLRADLRDAMIFPLISLTFDGERHDRVVAAHGLERFLAPEDYKHFAAYLRPTTTYRLNGAKIQSIK